MQYMLHVSHIVFRQLFQYSEFPLQSNIFYVFINIFLRKVLYNNFFNKLQSGSWQEKWFKKPCCQGSSSPKAQAHAWHYKKKSSNMLTKWMNQYIVEVIFLNSFAFLKWSQIVCNSKAAKAAYQIWYHILPLKKQY